MEVSALQRAIAAAGSAAKLAGVLGIRPQAIYQWDKVPADRVIPIEKATGVPREELRPDLYPPRAA